MTVLPCASDLSPRPHGSCAASTAAIQSSKFLARTISSYDEKADRDHPIWMG